MVGLRTGALFYRKGKDRLGCGFPLRRVERGPVAFREQRDHLCVVYRLLVLAVSLTCWALSVSGKRHLTLGSTDLKATWGQSVEQ